MGTLLNFIILIPIIAAILIFISPGDVKRFSRYIYLFFTTLNFVIVMLFFYFFKSQIGNIIPRWSVKYEWLPFYGVNYYIGIDGISFPFVFIVNFLFLLSALLHFSSSSSSSSMKNKDYAFSRTPQKPLELLLLLQAIFLGYYMSLDLFLMFVFFFIMIIPIFFLLLSERDDENSRTEVVRFSTQSLLSSFLLLVVVLGIYFANGTTKGNFDLLKLYEVGTWIKNVEIFQKYFDLNIIFFWLLVGAIVTRMSLVPLHQELKAIFRSEQGREQERELSSIEIIILALFPLTGMYLILKLLIPLFSELVVKNHSICMGYAIFGALYASIGMLVDKRENKISFYNYILLISLLFFATISLDYKVTSYAILLAMFISVSLFYRGIFVSNVIVSFLIIINIVLGVYEKDKMYSFMFLTILFLSTAKTLHYFYKAKEKLKLGIIKYQGHLTEKIFIFLTCVLMLMLCIYPAPISGIVKKPLKQLEVFLDSY
ncbi:MAG: hypothetical protein HQK49_20805 [Oligoflexia bacterium]|nr:hypothetical protein [Oligoflexia bacterium]